MSIEEKINQWVRPEIRAINAYHVPNPGKMVKLDAMENPYTWPQSMVDDWLARLGKTPVNRYPDPAATELTARLKSTMGVPASMSLLLGNGSDEIIQIMAMAMAAPGRTILAPEPGFVMYKMIATFCGMDYVGVPLRADFSLDRAAMLDAINTQQPALIFIAYPNNPTGNLFDDSDIEAIIEAADGLVVIDEAYHAFAQRSWMERLGEYDNVVVMRTVSKLGLAGLRLGLLAGDDQWLSQFDKIRLPYNINVLTQASAEFALEHMDVFDEQTATLRAERERVFTALSELEGITPFPSRANFILLRTPDGEAAAIFESLKQQGILIKNLSANGGLLSDCLRITIGTPEENDQLLAAFKTSLT